MNASELYASDLLSRIRRDLEGLSDYTSRIEQERQARAEDPPGMLTRLGDYNYATYTEICHRDGVSPDFKIDSAIVQSFECTLNQYLDTYAPGKTDLKRYVLSISLYLTFIVKRPLHPPGPPFFGDLHIIQKGESYYCSGKKRFIRDPSSLCRYCVCKSL